MRTEDSARSTQHAGLRPRRRRQAWERAWQAALAQDTLPDDSALAPEAFARKLDAVFNDIARVQRLQARRAGLPAQERARD
jgi:hypothetical protein